MQYPEMIVVRQKFDSTRVGDVHRAVMDELNRIGVAAKVRRGQRVAITAGSRGIANIATATGAVCDWVKARGAEPFIFPAMGSHGGATAEGQVAVLSHYGITEESMGTPILSTMEVEEIGRTEDGLPIYLDKHARTADHIIVVNRVKPHTKFEGEIESGLMKMMAIGMGKHKGAQLYHKACIQFTMNRVIDTVGLVVMAKSLVLCGLALVENGYDETAIVRAVLPEELVEEEKKLLVEARRRMAQLPFAEIDILIVDEMGKNISGTGMDTNVTGVNRDILGDFTTSPRVKRLFARDLTPESEGNAVGIGLASFVTTRLVQKMDRHKTYINAMTGISPEKAAIPMYFDTDEECINAALDSIGMVEPQDSRIVHIRNTLHLDRIAVSRAYEAELKARPDLTTEGSWARMSFGEDGTLASLL